MSDDPRATENGVLYALTAAIWGTDFPTMCEEGARFVQVRTSTFRHWLTGRRQHPPDVLTKIEAKALQRWTALCEARTLAAQWRKDNSLKGVDS